MEEDILYRFSLFKYLKSSILWPKMQGKEIKKEIDLAMILKNYFSSGSDCWEDFLQVGDFAYRMRGPKSKKFYQKKLK